MKKSKQMMMNSDAHAAADDLCSHALRLAACCLLLAVKTNHDNKKYSFRYFTFYYILYVLYVVIVVRSSQ